MRSAKDDEDQSVESTSDREKNNQKQRAWDPEEHPRSISSSARYDQNQSVESNTEEYY